MSFILPRCSESGKVCFTKREAQAKANQLDRLTHRKTRYYHHPECNWWHISTVKTWRTINNKAPKRRKRRKDKFNNPPEHDISL